VANQYPWCSARWFERTARPAQIETIYRLKVDRLTVPDNFEVSLEWRFFGVRWEAQRATPLFFCEKA
jgi:hypothetical protein